MMDENRMERIPTGSGFWDIYLFLFRGMVPGLGILLILISVLTMLFISINISVGNFEAVIYSFSVFAVIFLLFILSTPIWGLMVLPSALMIWAFTRNGNGVHLNEKEIHVDHQNWSLVPSISNYIPLSMVAYAEKAGQEYWDERWDRTGWFWKIVRLMPLPPKGGLYPMYSRKKNLVILYLNSPLRINNQKVKALSIFGMTTREHWVEEVIIDIDPDHQQIFIDGINENNERIRSPFSELQI